MKTQKPIIRLLLSLFAFVMVIAATAPVEAAEIKRYPTQYDFQQIVSESVFDIATDPHKRELFETLPDEELGAFLLANAIDTAERYGEEQDVFIANVHVANIIFTLSSSEGGKYWHAKPKCSNYNYRELLWDLFPDVNKSEAINLAYKVKSCRLETL